MDKNKEFIREHGKTIKAVLINSKLNEKLLKQRTDFFRKCLKTTDDMIMFDTFKAKIEDIMRTVGKNQFTEEDIDIIMHQALGVDIREYDKSYLINLDKGKITTVSAQPLTSINSYTFGDTTITPIGILTHEDWRGLEDLDGLTYYKIDRKDVHDRVHTHRIFSHINIEKMEDDIDYREAVIYDLLDENNITKTNCNGYIGSIESNERAKGIEESVKVNDKYSLVFDSTDATAVMILRNLVEQNKKKKNEEER